jgi:hypothetical protein
MVILTLYPKSENLSSPRKVDFAILPDIAAEDQSPAFFEG